MAEHPQSPPKHSVTEASIPRDAAVKIFLCMVLVAGLAVIVGMKLGHAHSHPHDHNGSGWLTAAPWVFLLVFLVWLVWRIMNSIAGTEENNDAVALLEHDLPAQRIVFQTLAERTKSKGPFRAMFLMNLGYTRLRMSDLSGALDTFDQALAMPGIQRRVFGDWHVTLLHNMAVALALKGDLEQAAERLRQAEKTVRPAKRGLVLLCAALIALRRGESQAALSRLEADWALTEGVVCTGSFKPLRLLRAFAVCKVAPDGSRNEEIAQMIGGLHPLRPGQIEHLSHWPEMREFMRAQHLIADSNAM